MAFIAGYSCRGVFFVQSPVAATISIGRGAIIAAISTLKVSTRNPGAFSHGDPPCIIPEIMFTGADQRIRSSTAVNMNVCVAPPDAPVAPIRSGSTSGNADRKSTARIEFHNCNPNGPQFHNGSPKACGVCLVSLYPTMS